ncbi:MAG TPA: FAD-binding protein [Xanthobacteraceae bacterium]|nr:FAD-binding protein [Xanthobacteraceae bacterium]
MTDILKPDKMPQVEEAVRWALTHGKALEVLGAGSKRAIGRPAQTDLTLDLSGLTGMLLYEPDELVLSARAGTPLAEIEAMVAASGQELAFEPMSFGALLGAPSGGPTIGGVIAANVSGPRRFKAGAARDHLLGFTAVSGRGEVFKSGGRVVKNVTGYDLCKLMAGSWGTLAVLLDITIKILPRPEMELTVLLFGLDDGAAVRAMTAALASNCDVSGAAHLPAIVAARVPSIATAASNRAVTALRLEGVAPGVAHRRAMLERAVAATTVAATDVAATDVAACGEGGAIEGSASRELWRAIRDVEPFAAAHTGADRPLWRVSIAPSKSAALALAVSGRVSGSGDAQVLYDWGGGLLWILPPPSRDGGAALVRSALAAAGGTFPASGSFAAASGTSAATGFIAGGHATLIRAPAALRAAVDVFQPQEPVLAALTKRVKESFDPKGVLNPGRMWAGV